MLKIFQLILKNLAQLVLNTKKPIIIAVTGSVAKTSTKEAIYKVLSKKLGVRKSEGNLNNEIGLPLAILGFKKSPRWFSWLWVLPLAVVKSIGYQLSFTLYHQILILEMAADKPGDIEYLTSFIHPKIAVVTAVGHSHLEKFTTIEKVAQEKAKLVEILPLDGYAVLNQEDALVMKMVSKTRAKIITFSPGDSGIARTAAEAVGKIFRLKSEEIKKELQNLPPLKGRMNILEGIKGSILIDDCYNSNPASASYALGFLRKYSGKRKIAVLGDMLELGDYTQEGHREIGKTALKSADLLLTNGENARLIAGEGKGRHFRTKQALVEYLRNLVKKGDIILIKASRGMKFEEIVDKLKIF